MKQTTLAISTAGPGLYEFTDKAVSFVREARMETGLLTVFARHTSCSLLIQENADPDVRRDLDAFFARLHEKFLPENGLVETGLLPRDLSLRSAQGGA